MEAIQTCVILSPLAQSDPESQAQRTLARRFNVVPIISAGFAGITKRPTLIQGGEDGNH